jgi:putative heme-binding domain-containing protein
LTSLTRRFSKQEAIEAILFPSHVVSDQYATKRVLTRDGEVVTGIVTQQKDGVIVKTSDRREVHFASQEIEEIIPSKQSLMPSGLLDDLTPIEIRDLLCYLGYVPPMTQIAEPSAINTYRR